jgi:predicted NBD/HSP70 family sugar kinase
MEQYVGLDVSQQTTHLCVIDKDGKTVWRGQCASTPEAIAKAIETKVYRVNYFCRSRQLFLPVVAKVN